MSGFVLVNFEAKGAIHHIVLKQENAFCSYRSCLFFIASTIMILRLPYISADALSFYFFFSRQGSGLEAPFFVQ